jgi:hypothetical protein
VIINLTPTGGTSSPEKFQTFVDNRCNPVFARPKPKPSPEPVAKKPKFKAKKVKLTKSKSKDYEVESPKKPLMYKGKVQYLVR